MQSYRSVAIVGCGRVGRVLARAFHANGFNLLGVVDVAVSDDEWLNDNHIPQFEHIYKLPAEIDLIILSVPDREIEYIAQLIIDRNGFKEGTVIAHTAGALSEKPLEAVKSVGAIPLTWHPLQTFSLESDISQLEGVTFGISGDPEAIKIGEEISKKLGGHSVVIPSKLRPLYHLSAVFSSNLIAALIGVSLVMLKDAGLDEDEALAAIKPLLTTTLNNVFQLGVADSITGPVQRRDVETVESHLKTLEEYPRIKDIYRLLSLELLKRTPMELTAVPLHQILKHDGIEQDTGTEPPSNN